MKVPTQRQTQVEFTLDDDYGGKHTYFVILHPAGTGWPLGLKLLKLFGPALGVVMDGANMGSVGDALGAVTKAAADMEMNATEMGTTVGVLAGELLDDPALIRSVFEHTNRDTFKLEGASFDSAYQANYGELVQALYRVIKANFGPLFRRYLGQQSTNRAAIATPVASSTATQAPS